MREKYIITFITEILVLISGILVYKLAAIFLGKEGFSEYALSRRAVALMQPALLMGLSVGLPRYIAFSSKSASKYPDFYFVSGASAIILLVSASLSMMYLLREEMAFLLFGSSDYRYAVLPIGLMMLGIIIHSLCYSYFRGKLFMIRANVLQIVNIAILPLAVFLLSDNTRIILGMLGISWCVTSTACLCVILKNIEIPKWRENIFPYAKELLTYGIPRVPGDFGMAALLSLVAIFTAHTAGVKEAGYVAFGVSLLSAGGSSFAPIGVVLLPHASQMVANMEVLELRRYVRKILYISLCLTILGVILFEILAERVIELYLGTSFLEMTSVARIIAVSIIPYTVFVCMRSVIDSYHVKAVNTKNILLSLSLFLICVGVSVSVFENYKYLIVGFVLAMIVLGLLTFVDVRRIFAKVR